MTAENLMAATLLVVVASFETSYSQAPRPNHAPKAVLVTGEGYEGAIFATAPGHHAIVPDGVREFWTPTKSDVSEFEQGLRAYLESAVADPSRADERSPRQPQRGAYLPGEIRKIIDNLPRYRRQYYGVVIHGSRQLYVNFFPAPGKQGPDRFPYWLESFVVVRDGGAWFWRIQYDPLKKKYLGFHSNGYA